jgi:hypothetical protein
MAKIFWAATDTYSVDQRRKNYEKDRHFATTPVAPRTLKRINPDALKKKYREADIGGQL